MFLYLGDNIVTDGYNFCGVINKSRLLLVKNNKYIVSLPQTIGFSEECE